MPTAIIVHGGAGASRNDEPGPAMEGCREAARAGHAVLRAGGSALDAVQAAVVALEDNPLFNAGTGSCLNADGEIEMDAAIMDGATLAAGAVGAVRTIQNPIVLARRVMERTPHVLLCADGALRFAREVGIEPCDPARLVTARARERYERERAAALAPKLGTVGAVALDAHGHVAAATSTGGISGKRVGRIGDTPVVGAGTYADDLAGAASATGLGEAIMRVVLTKYACDQLAAGEDPAVVARAAMRQLERVGGTGGIILVDRLGRLGFAFNTERMARAEIDSNGTERAGFAP